MRTDPCRNTGSSQCAGLVIFISSIGWHTGALHQQHPGFARHGPRLGGLPARRGRSRSPRRPGARFAGYRGRRARRVRSRSQGRTAAEGVPGRARAPGAHDAGDRSVMPYMWRPAAVPQQLRVAASTAGSQSTRHRPSRTFSAGSEAQETVVEARAARQGVFPEPCGCSPNGTHDL